MGLDALKTTRTMPPSAWLINACGIWLVGLGLYFIALRPPLLPEDLRFMGATVAQLQAALPGLQAWLKMVFTVIGGFMVGAGVLTAFLAVRGIPTRMKGTTWVLVLAGLPTVALMCAVNFALHSDFRWLLVVPVLLWICGLALYVAKR